MKELIKRLRIEKELTQQELADKVGVVRTVITMLETDDDYKPSVDTAKALGNELGFDWTLFFEERGE